MAGIWSRASVQRLLNSANQAFATATGGSTIDGRDILMVLLGDPTDPDYAGYPRIQNAGMLAIAPTAHRANVLTTSGAYADTDPVIAGPSSPAGTVSAAISQDAVHTAVCLNCKIALLSTATAATLTLTPVVWDSVGLNNGGSGEWIRFLLQPQLRIDYTGALLSSYKQQLDFPLAPGQQAVAFVDSFSATGGASPNARLDINSSLIYL